MLAEIRQPGFRQGDSQGKVIALIKSLKNKLKQNNEKRKRQKNWHPYAQTRTSFSQLKRIAEHAAASENYFRLFPTRENWSRQKLVYEKAKKLKNSPNFYKLAPGQEAGLCPQLPNYLKPAVNRQPGHRRRDSTSLLLLAYI